MTEPLHLDPDVIAAMADGRCSASERDRVLAHLAACPRCCEVFADTIAIAGELATAQPRARKSIWPWVGPLAVAAAVVMALWLRPADRDPAGTNRADDAVTRPIALLAASARQERLTVGRLGPPFIWAPPPAALRSGSDNRSASADRLEALAAIRRATENRRDPDALNAVGVAALASGRLDESIAALSEAARASNPSPDLRANLSAVLLERWRLTSRAADAAEALNQSELALQTHPEFPAALFNKAQALEAIGLVQDAIEAWTRVRDAEPGSDWAREAGEHIARLRGRAPAGGSVESKLLGLLGRWADATERRLPPPSDWAEAPALAKLIREGNGDALLPDLVEAARTPVSPTARDCLSIVIRRDAESRLRFDESNYAAARFAAEAAVRHAACAGVDSSPFQVQAAWSMFFANLRPLAHELAARALPGAVSRSYWRAAAIAEYLSGLTAQGQARLRLSLEAFERAGEHAHSAHDVDLTATIYNAAAETHTLAGAYDDAWPFHQLAFEDLRQLSPRRRHVVLTGATLTSLAADRPGAAIYLARLVVANAEAWGRPSGRVSGYFRLAQALARLGRIEDAAHELSRAHATLSTVPDARERARYAAEIALFQAGATGAVRSAEPIADLARAGELFAEIPLPQRLPEMLLTRSRVHIAAGRRGAARADLRAGIEVFEQQTVSVRERQLAVSRRSALWGLFEELIRLEADPAASLAIAERARARALLDSLARNDEQKPLTGRSMFDWIPPSTTVLAYATLPEGLWRWEVSATGVELIRLPLPLDELTMAVDALIGRVRLGTAASPADRHLIQQLVPEALARRERRIILIADGPLHRLPLDAVAPERRAASDNIAVISSGSSLTLLRRGRSARQASDPRALVVGVATSPGHGVPPLPEVARELQAIADRYSAVRRLEGTAATSEAILRALPGADVIHFAGHAIADELTPSESRLLVAPFRGGRGELRAEDIAGVRLRPGSVVVLSACSTARGRVYRGEGPMTLARPFLAAGASAVVATLWPVRDGALIPVLTELHRNLRTGMDAPLALARARRTTGSHADVDERSLIVIGSGG
jgi:tetratricopeptide (TPR) repeat protein